MRTKTVGTIVGSLGLLLAARSVQASDQSPATTTSGASEPSGVPEVTGSQIVNEMSGKPVCRDAGVTVSFTTASSDLDTNAKGALNGVVTWLKANPDRTLHLQGYADTTGSSEANLVLSEHRADAVKAYLTSQGVAPERIITAGRGEIADHLPANGRTVTFLACEPAAPGPTATPEPEAQPEEPPVAAVEPSPIGDVPPSPAADQGEEHKPWGSRFGFAFMAGGAYQDFTNDAMRTQTQAGGGWSARVIGGTRSYIGFEAAYVGSAQRIQPLGIQTNNSNLISNGGEGALRINIPIMIKDNLLEPYGFVGLGWSRYQISNYNQFVTSDFTRSDDVMTVPVGTGFAYGYKAFIIDARASWVPTYYNNLLLGTSSTSGTLNHWSAGGQVGFNF